MTPDQPDQLKAILGPMLERYAPLVPDMMADELVADDRGFLARYQLCDALLRQITPEMKGWATPDVLRAIYPQTPFSKTRMQPIAGALASVSCKTYPALSYTPYAPVRLMAQHCKKAPLIIAVHGSSRNPKDYRDQFATFAEEYGCFVMAPLFPMDLDVSVPDEEYKYLLGDKIRYDQALWTMVDEFSSMLGVEFTKILFFGFSGGAQFGHRMLYVCPEKFDAMSVAAPGFITLPSDDYDWWVGTRDMERLFGVKPDPAAMKHCALQLVCGADDNLPYEVYSQAELGLEERAYALYGADRMTRINRLKKTLEDLGLAPRLDVVSGAAHELAPLINAAKSFFKSVLEHENQG